MPPVILPRPRPRPACRRAASGAAAVRAGAGGAAVGLRRLAAPPFFGATRHDVTLQGIRFAVLLKNENAEVIRLGYLSRAERRPVPGLMVLAAEQASGCKVAGPAAGIYRSPSLPGDTGEARFQLKCP
ncbi:hypothetical protein RCAP_rcc00434 [Rhodobacter capsulatus SB 1003]|uniref:Uncharacterized protein n=1 Tax=Rhodobacter capsulatus (strain ATCC BAA-309 / NBRC 16581 / SB1003) TaxID=272942 RepID=D5AMR0_RHOCB|nr:hypothetical protein [Rhodobacter capsulatus]ADE84199.1 hypothetical protein RCAP_rcc00434 [Rhodobacter capsulatus SB 1003]